MLLSGRTVERGDTNITQHRMSPVRHHTVCDVGRTSRKRGSRTTAPRCWCTLESTSDTSDDAQVVASLLLSHQLALIQAGAYVSRGHCTMAEYPCVYERQRKRMLAFRPAESSYSSFRWLWICCLPISLPHCELVGLRDMLPSYFSRYDHRFVSADGGGTPSFSDDSSS